MCGFAGFTGYLADGDAVLERMMNKIKIGRAHV